MKGRRVLRFALVLVIAIGMIGASAMTVSAASTPAKVTGVKVTLATDSSVSLAWSKAKNAKKYEVQYKLSSAKKWTSRTTSSAKIGIKGLKENKKYDFKVRGVKGSKKGAFSKTVSQKTFIRPKDVDPVTIYAAYRDKRQITLGWAGVKNAKWYEVQTIDVTKGAAIDLQQTSVCTFETAVRLRPNSWYGFQIRGVNPDTGKFPAVKGNWSKTHYFCTTSGSRVIMGEPVGNVFAYEMNDTFVIDQDEALIPRGIYEHTDFAGDDPVDTWYETDVLSVKAVTFPADFNANFRTDYTNTDESLDGKTYQVGGKFEEYTIQHIYICPNDGNESSGDFTVTFNLTDAYNPTFAW